MKLTGITMQDDILTWDRNVIKFLFVKLVFFADMYHIHWNRNATLLKMKKKAFEKEETTPLEKRNTEKIKVKLSLKCVMWFFSLNMSINTHK